MDKRKELILKTIIKEHIKTGTPVGSGILVDKYKLNISSATVRNEMAELENEGYIMQPHTSAGRIPTEKAYDLYISALPENVKLKDSEIENFRNAFKKDNEERENFKHTAKALAGISNMAVFWAFHKHNLYYTGISNLFQQPEFQQSNLIYDISAIIDRMDEIIEEIFEDIKGGPQIMLGSENPFGSFCSVILTKYKLKENIGMFGILGPIRMDYEKNLALMKYINSIICE